MGSGGEGTGVGKRERRENLGGPAPQKNIFPRTAPGIKVINFNFLALVVSEILRGSQIYTKGAYALLTPLAEKLLYAKRVLHNI